MVPLPAGFSFEVRLYVWHAHHCRWLQRRVRVCAGADALTLALVAEQPSAHTDVVYSVSFSPDGMRIVSGSRDNGIKLWGVWRSPALCLHVLLVGDGGGGQQLRGMCAVARRRCDTRVGGRATECPQRLGVFRGLLARWDKGRVGLQGHQYQAVGWVSLACATLILGVVVAAVATEAWACVHFSRRRWVDTGACGGDDGCPQLPGAYRGFLI